MMQHGQRIALPAAGIVGDQIQGLQRTGKNRAGTITRQVTAPMRLHPGDQPKIPTLQVALRFAKRTRRQHQHGTVAAKQH